MKGRRWEVQINQAYPGRAPIWEEARDAIGDDPEDAAEEWARDRDNEGDYTIISGSPAEIRMRAAEGDADERPDVWPHYFRITGETCAVYRARGYAVECHSGYTQP